jgi:hypothetical protein
MELQWLESDEGVLIPGTDWSAGEVLRHGGQLRRAIDLAVIQALGIAGVRVRTLSAGIAGVGGGRDDVVGQVADWAAHAIAADGGGEPVVSGPSADVEALLPGDGETAAFGFAKNALDRVLAGSLAAPNDVPAFDRSGVGGFALRAATPTSRNPTMGWWQRLPKGGRGIAIATELYGMAFLQISPECFDFRVAESRCSRSAVQAFLAALAAPDMREGIAALGMKFDIDLGQQECLLLREDEC